MRTFTLACVLLAAMAVPTDALAEDPAPPPQTTFVTLEQQTVFLDGEVEPNVNLSVIRMLHGPFGAYSFLYVGQDYAEALVGPAFAPTDWLAIAAGVGLEQWPTGSWRVGGMIWLGKPKWTSLTLVETGASGFWARTEFAWRLHPAIGVGVLGDLLLGAGPRVEINVPSFVPQTQIQFWYAPLYDWAEPSDEYTHTLGVRLTM